MKKTYVYFLWIIILLTPLIACQKNEDCDPEDEESPCYAGRADTQYFTMKLDNKDWKAKGISHLFFVEHNEIFKTPEGKLSLLVNLMGVPSDGKEQFLISIFIAPEKISNPLGVYNITTDANIMGRPGTADLLHSSSSWPKGLSWQTRNFVEGSPDAGIVTITEFEKGDGKSTKQYVRLKGTFSGTIFEFHLKRTGETKSIIDGKFNLINQLYQK